MVHAVARVSHPPVPFLGFYVVFLARGRGRTLTWFYLLWAASSVWAGIKSRRSDEWTLPLDKTQGVC